MVRRIVEGARVQASSHLTRPRRMAVAVSLLAAVALGASVAFAYGASQPSRKTSQQAASAAHASCNLAAANKLLNKYTANPTFTAPGPAFNTKSVKGKVVYSIPIFSNSQFVTIIDNTMASVAKTMGIKIVLEPNQGKLSEWQDAMNRAIAARANAIFLGYAPDPKELQPQIIQAKRLGIPTISSHWYDVDDATDTPAHVKAPNLAADIPTPFTLFAEMEVLWAMRASNCNAHIVFQYAVDADPHKQAWNAARTILKKDCPKTCSITPVGLPYDEWATKSQSAFQAAITADPKVNWLIPFTDLGVQYAVAAIRTTGKTGKIKVASFNATPGVLDEISKNGTVQMDIGENLQWLGWAYMDQVMRVLAHVTPLHDEKLGARIFYPGNIASAGKPASYTKGYGPPVFVAGYKKLWGVG